MTYQASRSSEPERDVVDVGPGTEPESVESQRARRVRRSGTGYDLTLRHSDPTSLDPAYIVFTGGPVDQEPGRTSRLKWTKGRRRPITYREAYNVYWRRKAARLKKIYAEPEKHQAVLARMPATLDEALAQIPDALPPWDATRAVVKGQFPEPLLALAAAYMDIQQCSMPQLMEIALYRLVTAPVCNPRDFQAEYERMRQHTYQIDREQRRQAGASGEEPPEQDADLFEE